jgi:hypothetical protein
MRDGLDEREERPSIWGGRQNYLVPARFLGEASMCSCRSSGENYGGEK